MQIPDYLFLSELKDDGLRIEVMRELGRRDLYFLCRYILQYRKLETKTDIHYRLCADLDLVDQPDTLWRLNLMPAGIDRHIPRYLLLMFRGAFKTSMMMGKVIQWLIRDPSAQVGVGSDLKDRADGITRDIRNLIQNNNLLKQLYPEVFYANPEGESDIWRSDEFNIRRPSRDIMGGGFMRSSVNSFGLDPLPTGSHFTHVWFDDLENEVNQGNQDLVDKINRNFNLFFAIPQPQAPIVMSGTIYSKEGPNTLFQKRWKTYKRPIVDREGNPTFPSEYPMSVIQQKRKDTQDEWTWQGQYLLRSIQRTDRWVFPFLGKRLQTVRITGDWILHDNGPISLDDCLTYITVDPSGGASKETATPRSDRVGWWVVAVDLRSRLTVLEIGREYLSDTEFLDKLFFLYDKYHPEIIGIEKMPKLNTVLQMAFALQHRTIPIIELKHGGRAKEERIRGLLPLLPNLWFREEIVLEYQARLRSWYTEQEHDDDDHDAGAYMIDVARAPTRETLERKKRQWAESNQQNLLTSLPQREQDLWKPIMEREKRSQEQPAAEEYANELREFFQAGNEYASGKHTYSTFFTEE